MNLIGKLSALFSGKHTKHTMPIEASDLTVMVTGMGCCACDDVVGGCAVCKPTANTPRAFAAGTVGPPIRER